MKRRAICFNCGRWKPAALAACQNCHLQPTSRAEKARSIALSLAFEIDGEYQGLALEELQRIGEAIANGREYVIPGELLAKAEAVLAEKEALDKYYTPARVGWELLRFLGPAVAALIVVYWWLHRSH